MTRSAPHALTPRADLLPPFELVAMGGVAELVGSAGLSRGYRPWQGQPVGRVVVEVGAGLGDMVRSLALAAGIARCGRVGEVVAFSGRAFDVEALAPLALLPVIGPDVPPEADAVVTLGMTFLLGGMASADGRSPTADPLRWPGIGYAARAYGLTVEDLAGPVLRVEAEALAAVAARLPGGRPVVAVQCDAPTLHAKHAHLAPLLDPIRRGGPFPTDLDGGMAVAFLTRELKYTPALPAAVPYLLDAGVTVVAVGSPGPTVPGDCVDLRGSSLPELVATLALADVAVVADSGPLHLASVLGTPSVAVFTLSDPARHVIAEDVRVLTGRGCPLAPCEHGHGAAPFERFPCPSRFGACAELDPAEVARVALARLAELGGRRAA